MPKVTDEHREMMRKKIVTAATTCIARKGFNDASMSDIVAEAGLSAGAVYLYYKSKSELAIDVAREMLADQVKFLISLADQSPLLSPTDAYRILLAELQSTANLPSLAVQVWAEAAVNPDFADSTGEFYTEILSSVGIYLEKWLIHAKGLDTEKAQEQAKLIAPALVGMFQGGIIKTVILRQPNLDDYLKSMESLLEKH